MTEAFLQYVWQHQLLEGDLRTTEGLSVRVLQAGVLNTDAGPDFFNSRVQIDGMEWSGNIEIHVRASDWRQHGHTTDKAYNNVVLHVVYEPNEEIVTESGNQLPTLCIKPYIPEALWNNYDSLINPPKAIEVPCMDRMVELPSFKVKSYLERLLVERLERKCSDVERLLAEAHGGWEQCCYWLVAHYFGGKANAFPFELLAKSTDMRLVARWRSNPQRIEALFFGQAGLLEEFFNDEYPRQLQADYQSLRRGANLTPISSHLWRFFRLRPSSFPTLRISQFAQLLCQSTGLFSHLLETSDAERLMGYFDVQASEYWETHYKFDQPSRRCRKSAGKNFALNLIINAWTPLLFHYGTVHGDDTLRERAIDLLHQLPPEDNHILRQWREGGIEIPDAATSQALIQLSNNYCSGRRCLQCHIGYQVIKP